MPPFDAVFFSGTFGSSTLQDAAWAIAPDDEQGDPFNPKYFAGDGRLLIGQFSTLDGSAIQGTMLLQFISNGMAWQSIETFFVPGPGGLAMMGVAGLIGTRRRRRRGRRP